MAHTETAESAGTADPAERAATAGPGAWNHPRRRRPLPARRTLTVAAAVVAGCALLGGALVLLPDDEPPGTGALPDLSALIREREAGVRARPRDHAALAELGAAYVERAER
ncbi:hypothetical protein GTW43_23390, partial [Streptomyces sp. SID5785]|nr:hypothetical protein [Streptomyces sp. SID5785]